MPDIPTLPLPSVLPHSDAIKSSKQTKTDYESDCWEFQYEIHRYLGRITDDALRARYDNIVRNMHAIISDDRNVIPIHSFLSSWYWYRKEHQTRYEFALRNVPLHRPLPIVAQRDSSAAPARPRGPNAGDVLFRYGERKWLQNLMDFGRLRMKSAQEYALMEKDPARQDDERVKHSYSPGEYISLTMPDGLQVRPIGDLKYSTSGTDYFLYCVSMDWDSVLFDQFSGTDCCVVIKEPDEFARRLEHAAKNLLPGWYFHHCPIEYFDTYERRSKERIDNAMSKDFRFAYQKEYRFLFAGFGRPATGFIDLELGPLHDIAELHMRPEPPRVE
ncbi:MAG: hypothetical protein AB7F72_03720 [Afipia sp.]|jgi:hypothetical protein|uniref:Uncharacterized protein n=1 Tax=Candidatus Afipia apatlaquensis TaxID=2712852 RepID=A0A7C9VJ63_9BRAD|nr:hypothetical protein [Afipia sp.]NGX98566.1 hypothetical protein [Candidatus Afipia apatlaquensis]RTL76011.1 MAG: hypothetical protein EKK35_20920 [Bradyrhizobiaceae bacterium]